MHRTNRWSIAWAGLMALCAVAFPAATRVAAQDGGISTLAGNWVGGGQIKLEDGRSERLSCRANYIAREGGSSLVMSIRCASQSYKLEFRSSMRVAGGRVSGTWEERSFNAAGSLSGSSSSGNLQLSFSGTLTGNLSVSYGSSNQRVSISTGGGGISRVSVSLSRG